jgi:hypothetical protein
MSKHQETMEVVPKQALQKWSIPIKKCLHDFYLFPTCQVKVVRFYVSWPASSSSFLRRTSTASSAKSSPPDLNHKESPKIYQIECQKECQKI